MGGLGPHAGFRLRIFGAMAQQGFGQPAYHVGSSLTQKHGWRDVDVRVLLPDDEHARLARLLDLRIQALAWSALGAELTGLPIDFQVQRQAAANAEFDGPRSALVLLDTDLPMVMTSPHLHAASTEDER